MKPPFENMPAVSIIIPAYNTAPYIGRALDSVLGQTFEDYEVIVINDGSPDTEQLEKVLQPYGNRIRYLRQENQGVSAARNAGILAAGAPLIALLDSDDIWEPDYLAVQVGMLRQHPSIDLVYPNARYFGDCAEAGLEFMKLCPSEGEVTFASLVTQTCNVMASVTARRDVVVRAGLFDESLRASEDFDLWLRLAKQGSRIAYHRRVLVHYRRRAGSLMSHPVENCLQILRVFGKCRRAMDLTEAEKNLLRRTRIDYLALRHFFAGKRYFLNGDTDAAIRSLGKANAVLQRPKLGLGLLLLRVAPRFLLWLYRMRHRRTRLPGNNTSMAS